MAVRYSTNWMGPISLDWYKDRNLTSVEKNFVRGELVESLTINQYWSGGRIDIRGEGLGPYGDEIGLPIMRGDCYNAFSDWLDTFETDHPWTLAQIVELYERKNPKIIWAKDVFGDV